MTPVFVTRRRADEFAALVEVSPGGDAADAKYADVLELVDTMRNAPAVEARSEFVTDLRERLLVAAETLLVPGAKDAAHSLTTDDVPADPGDVARLTLPARSSRRDRRIAAAVGGLALIGATTSMAMAAQSSLPGDALYPIKRGIENVQTGVSAGEGSKGEHLLASAGGRLDEVDQLSRKGGLKDTLAIADTLNTFTDQATEASDLLLNDYSQNDNQASISDLRDFTSDSIGQLTILEPLVPEAARDELMQAANVVFQIDAEAQQTCPTCGGAGIVEVPNVFAPVSSGTTGAEAAPSLIKVPEPKPHRGGNKKHHDSPQIPSLNGGALPPGSVLDQDENDGSTASGIPTNPSGGSGNPIEDLTDGLTGGGGGSHSTSNPQLPTPSDLINNLGDTVGGVGDGVGDSVGDGVGDGVGGLLDGVTDPLNP